MFSFYNDLRCRQLNILRVTLVCGEGVTLLHYTADLHEAVPCAVLTGEVFIFSFHDVAFVTEILDHSAVRKSSARVGVAGVASVLRLIRRTTHCQ